MHLRRFRSTNVRDALRAVSQELGPNALVLSTAMVPARGWRGALGIREVEVTAAAEREESALRPAPSVDRQPARSPAVTSDIAARLVATGLDHATAEEVADALPPHARRGASTRQLQAALASRLAELASVTEDYARVEVFVGPPGAGKTTTIAKIAAQERARGGARLSLVAADGFRIGAVEQLRIYADILDAPFHIVRTADDLAKALNKRSVGPMLVDTAGRSRSDEASRELFSVLRHTRGVRTHLVLPAATTPSMMERLLDTYADADPARLILTKVDEADSLSPLVKLLRERQLPVSYLGTGQRVPEDLTRATPALLAASVLGEAAPSMSLS